MGNPKYRPGELITSIDELATQDFVFFDKKLYHKGWFISWPLRFILDTIKYSHRLRFAVKEEADGKDISR